MALLSNYVPQKPEQAGVSPKDEAALSLPTTSKSCYYLELLDKQLMAGSMTGKGLSDDVVPCAWGEFGDSQSHLRIW